MVDVGNLDLKVHPSPERIFQGRRTKAAPRAICLFEHQVDGSAGQISEALPETLEADTESKSVDVEAGTERDRRRQVRELRAVR